MMTMLDRKYIEAEVRESLKDFFNAQDSGNWNKYDQDKEYGYRTEPYNDNEKEAIECYNNLPRDQQALLEDLAKIIYAIDTGPDAANQEYTTTFTHSMDHHGQELVESLLSAHRDGRLRRSGYNTSNAANMKNWVSGWLDDGSWVDGHEFDESEDMQTLFDDPANLKRMYNIWSVTRQLAAKT